MKSINQLQEQKVSGIKKFFFPFAPIKTFKSLRLMLFMALIIALRVALCFVSIKIIPFSISISLGWVATMILGWYFGPVVGLACGIITDTLSFLVQGGVWFWLYAIQEPMVGLVSGLIGGIYRIRQSKANKSIYGDLIVSQIIVLLFAVATYVIILLWLNSNTHFQGEDEEYEKFYNIYKWVALSLILVFVVIYETLFILNIKKKINNKKFNYAIAFTYTSTCVVFLIMLFSFALGPLTAVKYLEFINGGVTPQEYLKYGSIFYLVPRVAIESVKVPIEIAVLFGVVCLFDKKVLNIVNKTNCSWNAK